MLEMRYFVIKPKSKYLGDPYATASRMAMAKYAECIRTVDPFLADSLEEWVAREQIREERDEPAG